MENKTFAKTVDTLDRILHVQQPLEPSTARCCCLRRDNMIEHASIFWASTCKPDCHAVNWELPSEVSGDTFSNNILSVWRNLEIIWCFKIMCGMQRTKPRVKATTTSISKNDQKKWTWKTSKPFLTPVLAAPPPPATIRWRGEIYIKITFKKIFFKSPAVFGLIMDNDGVKGLLVTEFWLVPTVHELMYIESWWCGILTVVWHQQFILGYRCDGIEGEVDPAEQLRLLSHPRSVCNRCTMSIYICTKYIYLPLYMVLPISIHCLFCSKRPRFNSLTSHDDHVSRRPQSTNDFQRRRRKKNKVQACSKPTTKTKTSSIWEGWWLMGQ